MSEKELFLSGYCTQIDQARMVEAVVENGEIVEVDCLYETCDYKSRCTIGKQLKEATKQ